MHEILTSRFLSDFFIGISQGVVYALVALSLVIIWQSTHILNFAQGAMAMLAAYVGLTQVARGVPYGWCLVIAIAFGFFFGGATERVLIRPLYGKPEINAIVVMVGFLGLIESGITAIWGSTGYPRIIPAPFSEVLYTNGGVNVQLSPWLLFEIGLALAIMLLMAGIFRYTKLGLQLRAAAYSPEVSRLLGVRVGRMFTIGWMLASAVGTAAAVVVSSGGSVGLQATGMDTFFIGGFIAAAVGGLESPVGAVAGGLLLGLATQFTDDYLSHVLTPIVPLLLLFVVLMVRPQGLFTRHASRRV